MDSNKLQTKITKLEKRLKRVEEYVEGFEKHNEIIHHALEKSKKENYKSDAELVASVMKNLQ
jgi:uncharacterized CHY-type Zn-finger protein